LTRTRRAIRSRVTGRAELAHLPVRPLVSEGSWAPGFRRWRLCWSRARRRRQTRRGERASRIGESR